MVSLKTRALYHGKKNAHSIDSGGDWVGSGGGVDALEKRDIACLFSGHSSADILLVAQSRYWLHYFSYY